LGRHSTARTAPSGTVTTVVLAADWIDQALAYPGIRLLELTPRVAVESTQLPGSFHRDPADQIIVATARVYGRPLVTLDSKILSYPHVQLAPRDDTPTS